MLCRLNMPHQLGPKLGWETAFSITKKTCRQNAVKISQKAATLDGRPQTIAQAKNSDKPKIVRCCWCRVFGDIGNTACNHLAIGPLPSLSCVFVEEAYVSAQGRRRSFEVQDTDAIQALGGSTALTPDFFTQQTVVNFN